MKLPLTQDEMEWLADVKAKSRAKSAERKGATGKQCRDCRFGAAHPFTDKLFYCMRIRNSKGKPSKTKRTWTCEQFSPRKEAV